MTALRYRAIYILNFQCNPRDLLVPSLTTILFCIIVRSKSLWLDGFLKLNSILTGKELSDLQEVMRDKELNLRTDIYEILLQDDLIPWYLSKKKKKWPHTMTFFLAISYSASSRKEIEKLYGLKMCKILMSWFTSMEEKHLK